MELIKQHIQPFLSTFLSEIPQGFEDVFDILQSDIKDDYKELLIYVDIILQKTLSDNNEGLGVLHLHLEGEFCDSEKLLIAEYLFIKIFTHYQSSDFIERKPNLGLEEIIKSLLAKQSSLLKCPDGASAINGGNRIYKNWVDEKKSNKSILEFYKRLNENSSLQPKSIFNAQKNIASRVNQIFKFKPYSVELGSENLSYNFHNVSKTLNEIDGISTSFIDSVETIILFDCERKRIMTNFSFEELNKWNSEYGTIFNKYLIITFGKLPYSLNNIRNKFNIIKERFKLEKDKTYTILAAETDFLLSRGEKISTTVEFIGYENSTFWEIFLLETSINSLYELRSIKMMNVYSVCLNNEIKDYIIKELFAKTESSELISYTTKQAILELRDDDFNIIKETLGNTLDSIIKSDLKSRISHNLIGRPTIIFDEAITKNVKLVSKIAKSLNLKKAPKFKSWSELTTPILSKFLILSYRDQGKYPNCYYPNLLEFECQNESTANAILTNFLFGHHYKWSKYYLLKEYYKYLSHPIRENYFEWNKFKNSIQILKPEMKLNIDWYLENEFSNSEQRETFKIKVQNQRAKTFNGSDLFILSDEKNLNHKVVKIEYLLSLDIDDGRVFIQNLDEIQENINIYEKIADNNQQEAELETIRKQFSLGDETVGRLWKILLKNIADKDGEVKLYEDIRTHFTTKGLKIVSQFHFKNSWINPHSESIAPLSKRVFIELCDYLKIPKIYYVIIQRIRNASKQSSRQSTKQMNHLLKDLFNDGCFDNDKDVRDIISSKLSYYKLNHPLDELGIDENYLADNLVTLTELIQPELKLLELETIEKISNE